MTQKSISNCRIISNVMLTQNHYRMEIETPEIAVNAKPGHFVMLKADEDTFDPLLNIPLGIFEKTAHSISVLYQVIGPGTIKLTHKRSNDLIRVLGPLGNTFNTSLAEIKPKIKVLLVAGGCGMAPLFSLIEPFRKLNHEVEVYIGVRSKSELFYEEQIQLLGAKLFVSTADGSLGYQGYITDLLLSHLVVSEYQSGHDLIYAAGPDPMLIVLAKLALKLGIPAEVSMDAYMACGIGACLGCAIKTKTGYKHCCIDGPVFDIHEIV